MRGSLKKDAAWTAIDTFSSAGLSLFFRLFSAYILSPHEFGVMAVVTGVWAILQIVNEFGMTSALIQRSEAQFSAALVNTTFVTSLIVSLLLTVLGICIISPLAGLYYKTPEAGIYIAWTSVALMASAPITVCQALLQRARKFREIAVARALATLTSVFLAAIVLLVTRSPWVVVAQILVMQFMMVAVLLFLARPKLSLQVDRRELGEISKFGGLVFLSDFLSSVSLNVPIFIIGRTLGLAEAGIFSLGLLLTDTVRKSLMSILNRILFVHYSRNQNEGSEIRRVYYRTAELNCRSIFPLMAGICCFGASVVLHFLGKGWLGMGPVLALLAVSVMVQAAGGTTSTIYKAMGRPGIDSALVVLSTTIMTIAMWAGVRVAGIVGAAAAFALAKLVSVIARQLLLDRLVGRLTPQVIRIVGKCLALLWPVGIAFLARILFWNGTPWIGDLLFGTVGVGGALALSFAREVGPALQFISRKG